MAVTGIHTIQFATSSTRQSCTNARQLLPGARLKSLATHGKKTAFTGVQMETFHAN